MALPLGMVRGHMVAAMRAGCRGLGALLSVLPRKWACGGELGHRPGVTPGGVRGDFPFTVTPLASFSPHALPFSLPCPQPRGF